MDDRGLLRGLMQGPESAESPAPSGAPAQASGLEDFTFCDARIFGEDLDEGEARIEDQGFTPECQPLAGTFAGFSVCTGWDTSCRCS